MAELEVGGGRSRVPAGPPDDRTPPARGAKPVPGRGLHPPVRRDAADPETIGPAGIRQGTRRRRRTTGVGRRGEETGASRRCPTPKHPLHPGRRAPDERRCREDRPAGPDSSTSMIAGTCTPSWSTDCLDEFLPAIAPFAFVGGGPRTVGLLERLSANAAELLGPAARAHPRHRPTSGRRRPDLADRPIGTAVDELDGPRRHHLHR